MAESPTSFTLEQASEELNLDPQTIESVLPKLSGNPDKNALTRDQLNEIVDLLNDPAQGG